MKRILIILALYLSFNALAQESSTNRFIVNDQVQNVLAERANCIARNKVTLKYYHIQLYNGQNMTRAKAVKSRFISIFPGVHSVVEWESPEFKVWVGEYENKLSADQALMRFRKEFPNAFIVNPKK